MTDEKALKVLNSWLLLAYHNADGTDEACDELYEALQTTFDLINRQKAEIERLTIDMNADRLGMIAEHERLKAAKAELEAEIDKQYEQAKADILGNMSDGGTSCHWCIAQHRAEAIKEFAARLKERKYQSAEWSHGEHPFVVEVDDIDDIAEEMVGDNNA